MDKPLNKIAIYSCNFGNYRNEIINSIDDMETNKNIDYYFFTDNKEIKSDIWNIIIVPLQEELEFIDANRHTAKYVKFIVPEILKQYEKIIWVDSKVIAGKIISDFSEEKINNVFKKSINNNSLFIMKHPWRKTLQEELNFSIRCNVENKIQGELFKNKITDLKFNTHLLDSCCIMYNNSSENISLFKKIYDVLIYNGLKRDQNIISYIFYVENYESNILYFSLFEIANKKINLHIPSIPHTSSYLLKTIL